MQTLPQTVERPRPWRLSTGVPPRPEEPLVRALRARTSTPALEAARRLPLIDHLVRLDPVLRR